MKNCENFSLEIVLVSWVHKLGWMFRDHSRNFCDGQFILISKITSVIRSINFWSKLVGSFFIVKIKKGWFFPISLNKCIYCVKSYIWNVHLIVLLTSNHYTCYNAKTHHGLFYFAVWVSSFLFVSVVIEQSFSWKLCYLLCYICHLSTVCATISLIFIKSFCFSSFWYLSKVALW